MRGRDQLSCQLLLVSQRDISGDGPRRPGQRDVYGAIGGAERVYTCHVKDIFLAVLPLADRTSGNVQREAAVVVARDEIAVLGEELGRGHLRRLVHEPSNALRYRRRSSAAGGGRAGSDISGCSTGRASGKLQQGTADEDCGDGGHVYHSRAKLEPAFPTAVIRRRLWLFNGNNNFSARACRPPARA